MKRFLRNYFQPAFLICVFTLASFSFGMTFIEKYFSLWLVKEPIPLKKSFDLLDETKLKPFEVLKKLKIENKEIVKSLGTDDYLQWILLDAEALPDSTAKSFMLFITYYEKPDSVPHVPEECYSGGGFQKDSSKSLPITFNVILVSDLNGSTDVLDKDDRKLKIPGQYIVFSRESESVWQPSAQFPVLYFFNVNGSYVNTRTKARIGLKKNIWSKHSYFCKIEFVFNQSSQCPNMEDAVRTCEKLLARLLPLLENEHWPEIYSHAGR